MVAMFGYFTAISLDSNSRSATYDRKSDEYKQSTRRASDARDAVLNRTDKRIQARANELARTGDRGAQLAFLVAQVGLARHEAAEARQAKADELDFPRFPDEPWYLSFFPLFFVVPLAAAGLGALTTRWLLPRSETTFLIGAEVQARLRDDRRRERIVWGIGVALVVGVVSGLIVSLLA